MGQRADEQWPPAQTRLAEFLEQAEGISGRTHYVSPNRQGWRARLANVERMLTVADRWFTAETLTDYRVERGRGCLDDALAEVRAMIDGAE
jgi:hypothetical protein